MVSGAAAAVAAVSPMAGAVAVPPAGAGAAPMAAAVPMAGSVDLVGVVALAGAAAMAGSVGLAGAVTFAAGPPAAFAATAVDARALEATGGSGTDLARAANAASEDCTTVSDGSGFLARVGSTSQ